MFCSQCGTQVTDGQAFCSSCGAHLNISQYQQTAPVQKNAVPKQMPMKWYKFLVYSLIVGHILNIVSSLSVLVGGSDTNVLQGIPHDKDKFEMAENTYAAACLIIGIIGLVTWYLLKNYRKDAPRMVTVLGVISSIFSVLYVIMVTDSIYDYVIDEFKYVIAFYVIFIICTNLIFIYLQHVYFIKRAHLFVN